MENLAQLAFGVDQDVFLRFRKTRTRPVDIEVQHGHGRLIGRGFSPGAAFGRSFQGKRDAVGALFGEDIWLQIKRIAVARYSTGPIPAFRFCFHLAL